MKFIKRLFITIIVLIAIVGVAVIGGYVYVRTTYGIDLFDTVNQLITLSKQVNEQELYPQAYSESDFSSLKINLDGAKSGIIKYEEGSGYNGYSLDLSAIQGPLSVASIKISERQVGAFAQTAFYSQTGGEIQVGDKNLEATIIQVDFSEIFLDGSANFNVVIKLSLLPYKQEESSFAIDLLKKYVPDYLYVSSTVRVDKSDSDDMSYIVSHVSLAVNGLTGEDTEDLFRTLNLIMQIGSAESLNMQIGTMAVDMLVGKDGNGLVYSLKSAGASGFAFVTEDETDYFLIR